MPNPVVTGCTELVFLTTAFIGEAPLPALLYLLQIILMAAGRLQAEGEHQILPLLAMGFDAALGIKAIHDVMGNFMSGSACTKNVKLAGGHLWVVANVRMRATMILSGRLPAQIEADFRYVEASPVQFFRHRDPVPGNMQ